MGVELLFLRKPLEFVFDSKVMNVNLMGWSVSRRHLEWANEVVKDGIMGGKTSYPYCSIFTCTYHQQ
jgi:hypothetical protein